MNLNILRKNDLKKVPSSRSLLIIVEPYLNKINRVNYKIK